MDSFAFIEEVWTEEESCLPKSQDDIMSSFIDNDNTSCYPPNGLLNTFRPKQPIMDEVAGYDFGSDNLQFADYFEEDLETMKNNEKEKKPQLDYCELENDDDNEIEVEAGNNNTYQDIVEPYDSGNNRKPVFNNEMIIFILSGILLIFIIEKLITISMLLRRK